MSLGELVNITVALIQTVEDESLRKNLEREYMHAYRFRSAMKGQVTPKEIDKPPPLTAGSERADTIMGTCLVTSQSSNTPRFEHKDGTTIKLPI